MSTRRLPRAKAQAPRFSLMARIYGAGVALVLASKRHRRGAELVAREERVNARTRSDLDQRADLAPWQGRGRRGRGIHSGAA